MKYSLSLPRFKSRSTSAALALAAAIMLLPANLLPVLTTAKGGHDQTNTIFSGTLELGRQGLWAIAAIVFTASIVIPILKLAGLAVLLFGARGRGPADARTLSRIYAALQFIGRWSMLDVFLAGLLTGLVQFGEFAKVEARGGIVAFAAAVVLTVLATEAFDPREIWSGHDTGNSE